MDFRNLSLVSLLFVLVASDCPSQWHNLGLHCYFFSHDTETWNNAWSMCRTYTSHLAEITSEKENNFIAQIVKTLNHDFWIGAADSLIEGEWVWYNSRHVIDNSTYANWATNGLDNANDNENCAQIGTDGTWHDAQCDQSNYYICHRSIDHTGEVFG